MTRPAGNGGLRRNAVPIAVLGLVALAASAMILFSLQRPTVEGTPPTDAAPQDVGDALVGPVRFTVDASSPDRWVFFDFSTGAVVHAPAPLDWDIAFQRFRIIANGGPGFAGNGAIADLGAIVFDGVTAAPDSGWVESQARSDSTNAAIARWYSYGFTSHLLRPKPNTYAIRTADGRYAKLRVVNYYCPGATPGCLTFEYVYQGDGSPVFAAQ